MNCQHASAYNSNARKYYAKVNNQKEENQMVYNKNMIPLNEKIGGKKIVFQSYMTSFDRKNLLKILLLNILKLLQRETEVDTLKISG